MDVMEEVNTIAKYEGYIEKQLEEVNQFKKFESRIMPEQINYDNIQGLRLEAVQKVKKVAPSNIGQASRISGVTPADVSVLLIYMENFVRKNNENLYGLFLLDGLCLSRCCNRFQRE
jgi:tRNA uridine 5-carboxymethylaminomethyl modification enzyme